MQPETKPLTRELIVDAALAHAETHELETLSARGLAAQLGVTPMALYRHVRNKDEILDAVVDVLLARLGSPTRASSDWRAFLEAIAVSLRGLFVQHPVAVTVFARGPVTTPAARARFTASLDVLAAAGFAEEDAVRAYAAVQTYTVGFCTLEAARAAGRSAAPHSAGSPDSSAVLISRFVSDEQFAYGLEALLNGLGPSGALDR